MEAMEKTRKYRLENDECKDWRARLNKYPHLLSFNGELVKRYYF